MTKKKFKILFGILIFLILAIAYSLSNYNPIYRNEKFESLTNKLKNTQKENLSSFSRIYKKINTKLKNEKCPCDRATDYIGPYRHGFSITQFLYQLKIQRNFTQTDCFKFLLLNTDFKSSYSDSGNKTFGIKEASKFYFNKKIVQLNEDEILTLIAMLKNPGFYDPIRNKKGVQNRVLFFKKVLHNEKLKKD